MTSTTLFKLLCLIILILPAVAEDGVESKATFRVGFQEIASDSYYKTVGLASPNAIFEGVSGEIYVPIKRFENLSAMLGAQFSTGGKDFRITENDIDYTHEVLVNYFSIYSGLHIQREFMHLKNLTLAFETGLGFGLSSFSHSYDISKTGSKFWYDSYLAGGGKTGIMYFGVPIRIKKFYFSPQLFFSASSNEVGSNAFLSQYGVRLMLGRAG
jgi:hypothetical protein